MKRRTFIIGSISGISLLAVSACTSNTPTPIPTVPTVPSTVPKPIAFRRTSWTTDPFSRGAFSFMPVGSSPDDRVALRQPIDNRLFFAGEATSDGNPGTVYGARASGVTAALEAKAASEPGERITIVGAGIAGATAAKLLADDGFSVVVLEGRDRAGGRVDSLTADEWPIAIELGAARVSDPASTIMSELDRLGIATITVTQVTELRKIGSGLVEPMPVGPQAVTEAILWASGQPSDVSLAAALRESGAADLDSVVDDSGVSEADRLEQFLAADITAERAVEPDELSAWFATEPLLLQQDDDRMVIGEYQKLVTDALTGIDVLPSNAVVSITTTESGVSLRLARGESMSTDRVIITVPLGVLKAGDIEFDPPLPFSHRGAIDSLGMGHQDKLFLRFDKPFWSTDATRWGVIASGTDFPLWYNLEPITGEPILVAVFGGDTAERLAESSDAQLLEAALESLEPFIDPKLISEE